jgi:hypothetical protein
LSNKKNAKLEKQEDEILLKEFEESLDSKSKEDMIIVKCIDQVFSDHELEEQLVDWCCICKRCEKYVNHLLIHCEIASALCSAIFSLVGLT